MQEKTEKLENSVGCFGWSLRKCLYHLLPSFELCMLSQWEPKALSPPAEMDNKGSRRDCD